VVVLPDDIAYGGELSTALRKEGIQVIVGPLPVLRREYARPVRFVGWGLRAVRGAWWLRQLLKESDVTLVVTNTGVVPAGPIAARLAGVAHLWYLREITASPGWYRSVMRRAAAFARSTIVTNSGAVAAWFGDVAGSSPVVVHNAIDTSNQVEPPPAQPTAVFVGRLTEGKGWDLFVDAARIVRDRIESARFVLAGGLAPGSGSDREAVVSRLRAVDPTETWLRWLGEVSDARAVMRDAWLVAMPSRRPEGLGNVVLEGMAEGRVVVAPRQGGTTETVVNGETGVLTEPGDVDALADAMTDLLSDRELALKMGARGRERAVSRFSIDALETQWLAVLVPALSGR
jgi:glycosyltransferase involved in cell wall biosynthesis